MQIATSPAVGINCHVQKEAAFYRCAGQDLTAMSTP